MRPFVLALSLAVLVLACGPKPDNGDGGTEVEDAGCQLDGGDSFFKGDYIDAGTSVEYEQQCSKPPNPLRNGLPVNGFCTIAERCEQVACDCASGTKRYAARACAEGVCQDKTTACTWSVQQQPALCQ